MHYLENNVKQKAPKQGAFLYIIQRKWLRYYFLANEFKIALTTPPKNLGSLMV